MCVFTFGFWSWISCRSSLYCSTSWSWRLAWVSSSCRQKHTHTHTDNQRVLWSVSWSADEIDTLNIHRRLGSIQSKERNVFNPDSPSSAHPFYVLDDFIDVGLIDLNLLPGNTQSDRTLSLSYTVVLCSGLMSVCVCVRIVLFCQMFLFGLRLVDLLRSPSIHLPLQLLFLPVAAGKQQENY